MKSTANIGAKFIEAVAVIKASCEADLAKALPALAAAVKALSALKKGDIVEIKAMKTPPLAVKVVMEAVCIMQGVKPVKIKDPNGGTKKVDDYWGPAQKQVLGNSNLLQDLMNYDKDNMATEMTDKIKKKYIVDPEFEPDFVMKKSVAAAGLCKWVHAMIVYDEVAAMVGPKKESLAGAESDLAAAMAGLAKKQAMLKEVMDKLDALNVTLKDAEDKKAALQAQAEDCNNKLRRAEQLISGLGGERDRWKDFSKDLGKRYECEIGRASCRERV